MLGNSGGDPTESGDSSGGAGEGGAQPDGYRSSGGGNRWPRQETVALIKIRTDMDVAFRDSSHKGPLWVEVSRKLAELGYHRSAKKCKEKFENVFKYHKRTKDGRGAKPEGKTYHFFDQLEALDSQPPPLTLPLPPPPPRPQTHQAATQAIPLSIAMPATNPCTAPSLSTTNNSIDSSAQNLGQFNNPTSSPQIVAPNSFASQPHPFSISFSAPPPSSNQNPTSISTSSSTSSDEELEKPGKRKRKWVDFFDRLTREVMRRQEEMQRKFLEALEKREQERVAREEAWRAQELARMNREREILAQERAVTAAKDAAVFAFLQKVSTYEQPIQNPSQTLEENNLVPRPPPPPSQLTPLPPGSVPASVQQPPQPPNSAPTSVLALAPLQMLPSVKSTRKPKTDDGGEIVNFSPQMSSSRWPKAEIEALIKLRTNLDLKYQEKTPKGPLWEEISAGMLRLGYNRNAKRCKEKWENINKYYKKVKESDKKRPEDSKTCPYFSLLEAIYNERANMEPQIKQENVVALTVAQPDQQWSVQNQPELPLMEGHDSDDDMDDDEVEEDEVGNYELVAKKPSTVGTVE